ncbi:MAG: TonB-dependent receptor, partial [Muribaculaceae bacterium]|nr:TonB-dependent receptor [Muribaculaceae bacterium]
YQVNHLAGLFSAFNTGAIRNVDFYKSSFPAKYDGRLSSFTDVHTRDGSLSGHHGSFQLGSTSAALSIDGPIRRGRTSYLLSVRRTWQELIAWPILKLVNSEEDEKTDFGYMFMDVNAKINHHFSNRSSVYVMLYYGYDRLHGGSEGEFTIDDNTDYDKDETRMRWGNTVLSTGWRYVLTPKLFGEFIAAYSRYGSHMSSDMLERQQTNGVTSMSQNIIKSDNSITDWIFRGDFDWRPLAGHKVSFGTSYTRHSFLPARTTRALIVDDFKSEVLDSAWTYRANEVNAYISDDWTINERLRANAGVHLSLFAIDRKTHFGVSPRLTMRYTLSPRWAVKGSYSRAVQYVHQLTESFISLPSDQWVPITGKFKPQTSDKLSIGFYYVSSNGRWSLSTEGFYKWLHNLVEYVDDYYLISPRLVWNARLTAGRGEARGLDFKLSKETGALTGHIGYSLLWANRTFADKNGGLTYPARFDNRHKLVVSLNWKASKKWDINVQWTGMSGNRFTLPTQVWTTPDFDNTYSYEVPLRTDLNNYRLPFYHRLDLGFRRYTRHGYWNFGLYNAYCHMNVVSVRRGTVYFPGSRNVFQQLHFLPIIPSISYTWQF